VIATTIFSKTDWLIFFNLFVAAGLLVGNYGVLQKLGVKEAIQGQFRIDGTIGNPTYLAAYLLLLVLICGLLFIKTPKPVWKYLYGAAAIFFVTLMYFAASRGVILALAAGVVIFAVFYLFLVKAVSGGQRLAKKIILAAAAALILSGGAVFALKNRDFVQKSETLNRLTSLSLDSKTFRARSLIWGMSWQAFKDRPILGWGQENYLKVFAKYYNPKMFDQEPWFDRAHNIVFDWLINAGALGLLSYLGIFAAAFYVLYRSVKEGRQSLTEGIVITAGLIAYFIQNLFVFDNFNTYVIFFALLAYLNSRPVSPPPVHSPAGFWSKIGLVAAPGFLVMLPIIYFFNIRPALQAKGIIDSLRATTSKENPVQETLANFQKTLAYKTMGDAEALEQFLRVAAQLTVQQFPREQKMPFVEAAAAAGEQYLKQVPEDIRLHIFMGNLYNRSAGLDIQFLERGREHILAAINLSPSRQELYPLLAENYFMSRQFEEAFAAMIKAVDLERNNANLYGVLGRMAALVERDDIVDKVIQELKRIMRETDRPSEPGVATLVFAENMDKIGNIYLNQGNWERARQIYEEIIAYRIHGDFYAHLANIYLKLGDKNRAIKMAEEAARQDPKKYQEPLEDLLKNINR
jgi:O-antigen ligase/tetratricopeptide (TPR) repeat protein